MPSFTKMMSGAKALSSGGEQVFPRASNLHTHHGHDHAAPVRRAAVLEDKDALPHSERHAPLRNRDGLAGAREHHAPMERNGYRRVQRKCSAHFRGTSLHSGVERSGYRRVQSRRSCVHRNYAPTTDTTTLRRCGARRCSKTKIPCQVPRASRPSATGTHSEDRVRTIRRWEGMSSGPSAVWTK